MHTPLSVRLAAMSASAFLTLALVQSIALLGHPWPAANAPVAQVAQAGPLTACAR